jgi:hypothetical protein
VALIMPDPTTIYIYDKGHWTKPLRGNTVI